MHRGNPGGQWKLSVALLALFTAACGDENPAALTPVSPPAAQRALSADLATQYGLPPGTLTSAPEVQVANVTVATSNENLITFDDRHSGSGQIFATNPYTGFTFYNHPAGPYRYPGGMYWYSSKSHSGSTSSYNGYGIDNVVVDLSSPRTFSGVWVSVLHPISGLNAAKDFWVEGYLGGVKVGETSKLVLTESFQQLTANFAGPVDRLVLRRTDKGHMAYGSETGFTTGWYLIDDLTFGPARPVDSTAPQITPEVTGTEGANGWYTSDVQISWVMEDAESPIESTAGCDVVTVTENTPGRTFTCTATSAGGTASRSITIKRDDSAPAISKVVAGTLGQGGWYTSDVTVTWTAVDDASPVSTEGCEAVTRSTDTEGTTYTCKATNEAGLSSTESVSVKRDASAPAIEADVDGTLGDGGWYTSNVSVTWSVEDDVSGVASTEGCSAGAVTTDTHGVSFACKAANGAGLGSSKSVSVKRDATLPVIGYSNNQGTYTVDQTIDIACSASDATSGLASTTCADVRGAAYTFALGSHTYSASATDRAGNQNGASATFEVRVSAASLCTLTRSWVGQAGVANSLCAKLNAAEAAGARGNAAAKQGAVQAFLNELEAQTGKNVSAAHASTLAALARAL